MCRWIAYAGPPIHLDTLLTRPENSLSHQSLEAHESVSAVNADGFGVGWYGDHPHPGIFKDVLPAWNDANLRSIAEQVKSSLFFGHVRAATGTAVNRTNCHPFRHGKWLFMHNGKIGGFEQVRRNLAFAVSPDLYPSIKGTTDSEIFFHLLLTHGLKDSPEQSLARTINLIEQAQKDAGIKEPFTMTVSISDGESIWAFRHASEGPPPSLYYGIGAKPHDALNDEPMAMGTATIILSEPLDDDTSQWTMVEPDHLVLAGDGAISVSPLDL